MKSEFEKDFPHLQFLDFLLIESPECYCFKTKVQELLMILATSFPNIHCSRNYLSQTLCADNQQLSQIPLIISDVREEVEEHNQKKRRRIETSPGTFIAITHTS